MEWMVMRTSATRLGNNMTSCGWYVRSMLQTSCKHTMPEPGGSHTKAEDTGRFQLNNSLLRCNTPWIISQWSAGLAHWAMGNVIMILIVKFLDTYYRLCSGPPLLTLPSGECHKTPVIIIQRWSRQQAIALANVEPDICVTILRH